MRIGGGPAAKRARRAELKAFVTSHMAAYPAAWLSAVDLARVISQQLLREPPPPSAGAYRWARSNITMALLRELAAEGKVTSRPNPDRMNATQWRWNDAQAPRSRRTHDQGPLRGLLPGTAAEGVPADQGRHDG